MGKGVGWQLARKRAGGRNWRPRALWEGGQRGLPEESGAHVNEDNAKNVLMKAKNVLMKI